MRYRMESLPRPLRGGRYRRVVATTDVRGGVVLPEPRARYSSYVTAACMEVQGLADEQDCYELRLLRLFYNEHVARLPGGPAILDGYRRMDARVMRVLGRMDPDRMQRTYQDIYEEAVTPVVTLILAGMWDEAHALYGIARAEVEDLLLGPEAQERAVG